MARDKTIFIKNIYYMLSYVFRGIRNPYYEKILGEEFENAKDFLTALLIQDVRRQLKQGLYLEYVRKQENISVLRGRVDIYQTVQNQIRGRQELFCEFDELSENNIANQILKSTLMLLEREREVSIGRRKEIRKILSYFEKVDRMEPSKIPWRKLQFYRENRRYEFLLNLCYFILQGLCLNEEVGQYRIEGILVEHLEWLFEKFVLAYYKRHHSYLDDIRARQIRWNLDEDRKIEKEVVSFLPVMKTDITLQQAEKILIIDTKYYSNNLMEWQGGQKIYSSNLYQIFAYVKNLDVEENGKVSGLLLYAKTEKENVKEAEFFISGNKIGVKTLDLGVEFPQIKKQLDEIVFSWIGKRG